MGRRSGRRRRERRRGSERREGQAAVDWVRVVWVAFPSISLGATTSAESRKEDPGCTARALPCTHASPRPLDPLARSVYSSLYSNDAILRSTSSADERPSSETCFSTPRSVGEGGREGRRGGSASGSSEGDWVRATVCRRGAARRRRRRASAPLPRLAHSSSLGRSPTSSRRSLTPRRASRPSPTSRVRQREREEEGTHRSAQSRGPGCRAPRG